MNGILVKVVKEFELSTVFFFVERKKTQQIVVQGTDILVQKHLPFANTHAHLRGVHLLYPTYIMYYY